MPSCRLLPHGWYGLGIACLSTVAWCASLYQDGCNYSIVRGDIVTQLASSNKVPYLEFGIGAYREPILLEGQWKVDYGTTCSSYPFEIDGAWKASKAFYFLALVIGGGGTVFLWCSTCFVFSRGTWMGRECLTQMPDLIGKQPDVVLACAGG